MRIASGAQVLEKRRTGCVRQIAYSTGLLAHHSLVARLQLDRVLEEHEGCVNRLAWNESGSRLASVSDDCRCIIWDVKRGAHRNPPVGFDLPRISTTQPAPTHTHCPLPLPAGTAEHDIETGHTRNIFGVAFLPQSNDRSAP